MFKRRKPITTAEWIRESVAPKSGWRRVIEYFGHRLKRLPDSPHKIALGFACGVFASFSPFFGLHFIYAAVCAMAVRGNVLAACIGTLVGNPITFPLIATISLGLGRRIFGDVGDSDSASVGEAFSGAMSGLWQSLKSLVGLAEPAWGNLSVFFWEVFAPYYVGGILPGLAAAVGFYIVVRPIVAAYQSRRRLRLAARAKAEKVAARAKKAPLDGRAGVKP